MIKCDHNGVTIKGDRIDLIYDFHVILNAMIKASPEIVAMAITLREDKILDAFSGSPVCMNSNLMSTVEELHKIAIAAIKEGEQ